MVWRVWLVALLLAGTACTGGAPAEQPVSGPDRMRIVVASGRDVTDGTRQRLIDAWNARQGAGGYKASLVELPGSADQQRSQLLGALQSGSSSYDIVNLDVTWVPEFAAAKLVQPLPDDAVRDPADLVRPVDETSFWAGKRYAVPFNSDVGLLYYRRDQVGGELGPVVTWSALQRYLDAVRGKRFPGWEAGWTTQLAPYEGRTVNAIEAFASAVEDLEITDENGRYRATEGQLTRGVKELRARTTDVLRHAFTSNESDSLSDFTQGKTTFLRNWPYAYPALYAAFKGDLGVTQLPGKAVLGGQNLAMTRSVSGDKAAKTADLIRFLTDADSERCLLYAGFAATRESSYRETTRCTYADTSTSESTGETPDRWSPEQERFAHDVLLPALRSAVPRPRTPLYGALTQTFTDELAPLFTSGADPTTVAKKLDEALDRELP
ncbi:extracellular solute-binding protein [Streptomyces niveiscabiei]|uniref:extracellular solute-binding protein n=1 Tax=Streptomyces niveiscabiei TaxID=164115 RepID=UPI0029B83F34|nr:extracellular solute-binding protein [Streptomyces niveiscabiei]MDX3383784.1 extracellular solute-binding protein [Streptomyces niveiscabiei]